MNSLLWIDSRPFSAAAHQNYAESASCDALLIIHHRLWLDPNPQKELPVILSSFGLSKDQQKIVLLMIDALKNSKKQQGKG